MEKMPKPANATRLKTRLSNEMIGFVRELVPV
jgi:hypothetical protein